MVGPWVPLSLVGRRGVHCPDKRLAFRAREVLLDLRTLRV